MSQSISTLTYDYNYFHFLFNWLIFFQRSLQVRPGPMKFSQRRTFMDYSCETFYTPKMPFLSPTNSVWYGILGFNVPLDTI